MPCVPAFNPDAPNCRFHWHVVQFLAGLRCKKEDLLKPLPEVLDHRLNGAGRVMLATIKERAERRRNREDEIYKRSKQSAAPRGDKIAGNYRRAHGGVHDAISENPRHPITDATFQFIVIRLQFLLDLRNFECAKAPPPAPTSFEDEYVTLAKSPFLQRIAMNDYQIVAAWLLEAIPESLQARETKRPVVREVPRVWRQLEEE
jgi:hypothetical protein